MVVYFDYGVSSGPFLRFSMRFEFTLRFLIILHSVCETRHRWIKAGGIRSGISAWPVIGHSYLTNRNPQNYDNHLSLFLIFVVMVI